MFHEHIQSPEYSSEEKKRLKRSRGGSTDKAKCQPLLISYILLTNTNFLFLYHQNMHHQKTKKVLNTAFIVTCVYVCVCLSIYLWLET